MELTWWQRGAIYQVYPRSFQDSDGDGVGDLEGVRRRLPYLKWLGVEGVWLSPFYRSPMADFGYDVTDHCDVDPLFGTLADFDALAARRAASACALILDYVPNHTSIEHPWFSERPEYYLWADDGAQQLGLELRRAGLEPGPRPLLLPRVPARAARPRLAQPGRARGDARRAALLVRARRRRLPDRRAAPARSRTTSGATTRPTPPGSAGDDPYWRAAAGVHDRPSRGPGRDPRVPRRGRRPAAGGRAVPADRAARRLLRVRSGPAGELPPAHHAVERPRRRGADRALRGRAAGRRVAELGARQPRPAAAGDAPARRSRARRGDAPAHPARHADALLRRRDRHARRRDPARAARGPVGVRQPRPGPHADAVGRGRLVHRRRAVAPARARPRDASTWPTQRERPGLAPEPLPPPARRPPRLRRRAVPHDLGRRQRPHLRPRRRTSRSRSTSTPARPRAVRART